MSRIASIYKTKQKILATNYERLKKLYDNHLLYSSSKFIQITFVQILAVNVHMRKQYRGKRCLNIIIS